MAGLTVGRSCARRMARAHDLDAGHGPCRVVGILEIPAAGRLRDLGRKPRRLARRRDCVDVIADRQRLQRMAADAARGADETSTDLGTINAPAAQRRLHEQRDVRLLRHWQEAGSSDPASDLGNEVVLAEAEDVDGHLARIELDASLE